MPGNSSNVFTKQQRIAELAKRSPQMGLTSLAYLMDIEWLRVAFRLTRKDGAVGVDEQTWHQYRVPTRQVAGDIAASEAAHLVREKKGSGKKRGQNDFPLPILPKQF
jgi:hypothetical protein